MNVAYERISVDKINKPKKNFKKKSGLLVENVNGKSDFSFRS